MKIHLIAFFILIVVNQIFSQNCSSDIQVTPNNPCFGQNLTLTAIPLTGSSPFTYLWGNGATTPTVTLSPGTNFTAYLTITDASGCTSSAVENVTLMQGPALNFSVQVLGNNTVQFTNTSGLQFVAWSFPGGTPSTSTAQNPVVTYGTQGDKTATMFGSNCTCGASVLEKSFTLGNATPSPTAAFNMSQNNGCAPMVIQFFDASTNATSRTWSFPGGTPATSTVQNPIVTYTTSGSFFATLTVSNSAGNSSTSQPVVVNSMADMQIISSDGQVPCEPKAIVCGTTTLTLTAPGAPATSSYVWGGGGTYKSKIITVYNNTQDVLTETFNCQVTSVDPFGNVTSTTHFFTIHVYPQMSNPIISTPTGGQVFCDEVVISCDLQEPAYTYTWYRSNNGGASWVAISGAGAELLVNELGTFLFKVKVTGPCGSKTSAPVTIIVNDCLVGNEEPDAKPEEEGVIKFYPSPFTDVLNVEITAGDYEVFFSNASGQIIQSLSVQGNFQIERGTLPPGIYILEIVSKGETILVEEVVII